MPSIVTEFIGQYGELLGQGVLDTLIMLFISTAIAYVIGTVLGVVLYLTSPGSLRPMRALNAVLGWVVNIGRSLPFIILLISLMPVTSALVGTTSGVRGVIPPLVVSTAPFVARMIEQSLAEVPRASVEAAEACGASIPRIVVSALLPEALPSIVRGVSITLIAVLGYTAIAGAVGAGGLGDIAIRYGYYRFEDEMMVVTVVLLIIIVQLIQSACDFIARKIDHRTQA
ncbi:ABC transporter permease [Enorma massiliensis]|uniref:Metal ABC transporter permease n=2 Tax=Enorma TaxID=1472762 RepID=A0A1Y3U157_9ACTN|nr:MULTISPECIES: methionine ABC transporter permease [Enorma]MBM6784057.1 ABC transporter permease [Enorma massiliensis]MRX79302.1 ABC transporter permease subunit [Enorma shizhengliae]OUN42523.1 metal ABC transporter permease [Enorma massiliensis]SCH43877.1 Methionine import system permease protein MetP [uncultured Collinsella sp.]